MGALDPSMMPSFFSFLPTHPSPSAVNSPTISRKSAHHKKSKARASDRGAHGIITAFLDCRYLSGKISRRMALITNSGIGITQFSGKLGSDIFARNSSGAYVKSFTTPTNPNTSYQSAVRTFMSDSVALWETLSIEEQEAWHQAAQSGMWSKNNRLGRRISQTGRSLFLHMNVTVAFFSRTITEPPAARTIITPYLESAEYINPGPPVQMNLDFSESSITSQTVVQFWGTEPLSLGVTRPKKSAFRRFTVRSSSTFASTVNVNGNYVTRFGTPGSGKRIFFRTTALDLLTAMQYQTGQAMIET